LTFFPESSLCNSRTTAAKQYNKVFLDPNMLQTIHMSHMPPELALHVALYRDVKNAAFLKQQLLNGNTDFEYAFIDASMVLTTTHVLAAIFRALNDYMHDRLKSRNVHSEIVFALSPNNNIGEAFRKFGIGDTTLDLLVVKVSTSPSVTSESVKSHLESVVDGTFADFNDENLQITSDLGKIEKAYKIASSVSSKGQIKPSKSHVNGMTGIGPTAKEKKKLEIAILGAIALRGAT
jgi:EKC/KEOPS complex subunit CGI121/TPRKB